MSNSLSIFRFEDFDVRIRSDGTGEPLFHAGDVCGALGYANPRDALANHVDEDDRNTVALSDGNRGNPNHTFITEAGLYALVFGCTLEGAKRFKHWVTHEVLPSIRKTGKFSIEQPVRALAPRVVEIYELAVAIEADLVRMGVSFDIAATVKFATVTTNTGIDLSDARKALPSRTVETAEWLNATAVGKMVNLGAQATNRALAAAGLQFKDEKGRWMPTEEGKKLGELKTFTNNGHSDVQLLWSSAVKEKIQTLS